MDTTALAWTAAAFLGTTALALKTAEERRPDDAAMHDKPLNRMLVSLMGGFALTVAGIFALYRYGIPRPLMMGVALYALYRLALTQDLTPYYRFNLVIAVAALISTGLVLAGQILSRSPL